ncbi:hypothetical protein L596_000186 [Steinernema carpocapsae]|uniref:Helicase ATP-binding domain-containing protein n=1 Tax=Steinernema carpocapsae TaxID=34508 RepID=A0A4U8UHB8_STECR|nr:hypothetical protein L596_000186 [Steinernema carpocapsae]
MQSDEDEGWGAPPESAQAEAREGEDAEAAERRRAQEEAAEQRRLRQAQTMKDEAFLRDLDEIVFSGTPVTIISAKPGTGKSTILPLYLCVQYDSYVVVTEPRIVAVDKLYDRALFHKHQSRADFEVLRCTRRCDDVAATCRRGPKPRLIFATDGKLVNRSMHNKIFGVYEETRSVFKSFLVIDEIHEMNLNQEIILAKVCEYIVALREVGQSHEFQVFIMSATIMRNGETYKAIRDYLRHYNLNLEYKRIEYEADYESIIEFSSQKMTMGDDGDDEDENDEFSVCVRIERQVDDIKKDNADAGILIFVPSMVIAIALKGRLIRRNKQRQQDFQVHIVFRATSTPARNEALNGGQGRIVICSNIAEPSLTIQDIDYVIDTGTVRRSRNYYELDTLYEERISQAEAIHRAGRVGRVSNGRVFRLYTQEEFEQFDVDPPSQSSREDARMVVAAFCSKMNLDRVSYEGMKAKMVTTHEGFHPDILKELASIGLLQKVEQSEEYIVHTKLVDEFIKQCSTFMPSYVGMMLSVFEKRFYEPYVAAQALLAAPNFWVNIAATELFPENQRPEASQKIRFNDGFSEMTTILKVYHLFCTAQDARRFCKENGIYMDAIFDAELQFESVIGHPMRQCHNLARAYVKKEEFQAEVAPHMYIARFDRIRQQYKIDGTPYWADMKESDAIYVHPGRLTDVPKMILCDGLMSTVKGKYFLVNTLLYPVNH